VGVRKPSHQEMTAKIRLAAATDAVEGRRPLASGKPFSDGREARLNDGALAQALRRDEAEPGILKDPPER
jgi:hypothetical protein